jgi:hypothetical protein
LPQEIWTNTSVAERLPISGCYRVQCQLRRSSLEAVETIALLWTALILAYGVIALAIMIGRWALLNRPRTGQERRPLSH